MKKILGISAYYHDSAAAIVVGGEIIAAAQEERFTRKKNTSAFPVNAIKYCLEYAGCTIDELDAVVFYDKPLLKLERLLETYLAFAPRGFRQFLVAMPAWLGEKLFFRKMLRKALAQVQPYDKRKLKLLFSEHHISHAASAFYASPYEEAAVLTIDGVGEWATATICLGSGNGLTLLREMKFPHSVGLLYSAFTAYLGFRVNSGEYKLMGLAPFGNPASGQTRRFIHLIKEQLVQIKEDGSVYLNQQYFEYATGFKMAREKKWQQLFGIPAVQPGQPLEQVHANLAYAIQQVTEEIVLKMAQTAKEITGMENLCLAGGVALNCVANGKLLKEKIFRSMYIQPAAGDAGGALGAALAAYYIYYNGQRNIPPGYDAMKGSYLGPGYADEESIAALEPLGAVFNRVADFDELCSRVASLISERNVVGWFQGRMEFGPRALGNRSILADARNGEMQKKLNLKIKYREGFRPFAPSILFEDAGLFFDYSGPSPYMLLIAGVHNNIQKPLPENYHELDIMEKLYCERSSIQPVTHVDGSARIQTVHAGTNKRYWQLLTAFKKQTGYGLLINTSFNVRGEPVVCTPADAYRCFMRTEMDYLVINNLLLKKSDQPGAGNGEQWKEEFEPD